MKNFKVIIGILMIVAVALIYYNSKKPTATKTESSFQVLKYDNIYQGDNIKFYYDNLENMAYTNLKEKYKVDEKIYNEEDVLKKLSLLSKWLKGEDREENKVEIKSSAQYLTGDESKILSDAFLKGFANEKDFNTVFAIMARTAGLQTRIVEFYQSVDSKSPTILTLTEVYIEDLKKWVLYDGVNDMTFKGEEPLSAIEVVESGLGSVTGVKSGEDYINKYGKYFDVIRTPMDSRVYDGKKINSYIMYRKSDETPQMIIGDIELDSTIFTKNTAAFSYTPNDETERSEDDMATLIVSMEEEKENKKADKEALMTLYIAAFKDSSNLKSFYISINDGEYVEVDKSDSYEMKKESKIKISLSEDGKNKIREIEVQF